MFTIVFQDYFRVLMADTIFLIMVLLVCSCLHVLSSFYSTWVIHLLLLYISTKNLVYWTSSLKILFSQNVTSSFWRLFCLPSSYCCFGQNYIHSGPIVFTSCLPCVSAPSQETRLFIVVSIISLILSSIFSVAKSVWKGARNHEFS